jgi:dihydrofolate reductase
MRKLLVSTFVSLDGVMQAPGGPGEDPSGGFDQEGWSVNYWDDAMHQEKAAEFAGPFDLLLGRRTYEIFAAHWPHSKEEGVAEPFNRAAKYVASRTLTQNDLTWRNSHLLGADVPTAIRKLKEGSGPELQVHGSANLIQTLIQHDLVDEFRVWTFPVLLGKGKRLFGEGSKPLNLKLVSSRMSGTGVTMSVYVPAGAIKLGSFALPDLSPEEIARREKAAAERR